MPEVVISDSRVYEFTFHFAPSQEVRKWWCPNCRNFLFFNHGRLMSLSEEGPSEFLKPPVTVICSKCRSHINIQTIV